jgi:hypothetical protein
MADVTSIKEYHRKVVKKKVKCRRLKACIRKFVE